MTWFELERASERYTEKERERKRSTLRARNLEHAREIERYELESWSVSSLELERDSWKRERERDTEIERGDRFVGCKGTAGIPYFHGLFTKRIVLQAVQEPVPPLRTCAAIEGCAASDGAR